MNDPIDSKLESLVRTFLALANDPEWARSCQCVVEGLENLEADVVAEADRRRLIAMEHERQASKAWSCYHKLEDLLAGDA